MDKDFVKAQSDNLPKVDSLMMALFFTESSSFTSAEIRGVKALRKLIFVENEILASPVNDGLGSVIAVIQREKLKTQEFLEKLKSIGLKIVCVEDTNLSSLQEALQYTSTVKMSPFWNILENILVEGSDFLTSNAPLKAVKMDVFVSSGEISLSLQPMCVRLPSMKLEHFVHPEQLMNRKMIHIDEFCHVLPSLKRGRITSVSRFPGVTGTFKSYEELKNHWNDMYGYILPNIYEERIWYYNVSFKIPFSRSYTYPEFCVKPYGMMNVARMDPRPILTAFVKDFCKRVGNICGEKCKMVEGRASFPALELYLATDVTENMKPRAGTTYAMKPSVPYRKVFPSNTTASLTQSSLKEKGTTPTSNPISTSQASSKAIAPPQHEILNKDPPDGNSSVHPRTHSAFISSQKEKPKDKPSVLAPKVSENPPPKIVPRFFPAVKKASNVSSDKQSSTAKPKPYAPVFLPKKKIPLSQKTASSQSKSTASVSKEDAGETKIPNEPGSRGIEKQAEPKIVTIFGNFKAKKKCDNGNNKTKGKNESAKKKQKVASKEKGEKPSKKVKKETKIKP